MSAKKISEYQIGDMLYRYVSMAGVFQYKVTGRRERESEVQLEVECQTCSHGYKCELLIAQDDYGHIVHVHMLNEDEDDRQRHWHTNDGFHFLPTSEEAKQEKLVKLISDASEDVRKAEANLATAKKRLADFKGIDEGVQP